MSIHPNDNFFFSLSTGKYLDTLPQGHTLLTDPAPPEMPETPCTQQISALIEEFRDLAKVVTNAKPSVISEAVEAGGNASRKKQFSRGTTPRLLRLRDAPGYLGMDINRFNDEVRPNLTEIPIGIQGVAFDRVDLDAWVAAYKDRNGRPGKAKKGGKPWDAKRHRVSSSEAVSGILKRQSEEREFSKALAQAISKKRRGS